MAADGGVVVTGASSGIGRACALRLSRAGFDVFAGVRKPADGETLREESSGRVTPVSIEVTDQASIAAAASEVGEALASRRLAGLVNNAGVAISAPIELIPIDALRRQLEVNLIGQVAVIQAFLPLLRAGRGRVVNVSSIGGRVALPLVGPYAASKFALEAISDSLRRELRPWGIEVSVIEPGSVATPIWDKGSAAADELIDRLPPEGRKLYENQIAALRGAVAETAARGIPPDDVARDVEHALTARRPRTRYLVGRDAKIRARIAKLAPDRLMDRMIARAMGM